MTNKRLAELQIAHNKFWVELEKETLRRIGEPLLYRAAFAQLRDEQLRGVPVKSQTTLEAALLKAEEFRASVLSERARKSRAARKNDPLQTFIEEAARRDPAITVEKLIAKADAARCLGVISDVTKNKIVYVTARDTLRDAPISGLKSRLQRAKTKFRFSN